MDGSWDETYEKLVRAALVGYPPEAPLEDDTALPAHGVDSMGMVALATALEDTYGFTFPASALVPSTFATAGVLWAAVRDAR